MRPGFVNDLWCFASLRPGSFHNWRHQDAGLVDEDYRGFPGAGFFLIFVQYTESISLFALDPSRQLRAADVEEKSRASVKAEADGLHGSHIEF